MSYEMCIDIGGTFTDLYYTHDDASRSIKTPTTHDDLTDGVIDAMEKAAAFEETTIDQLLADTDRIIHGTTIATNAIIEDETAKTALLCSDGMRDILTFREGGRDDPYDVHVDFPDPYIPRRLTYGVEERVNAEGDVEIPLDEDAVRQAIDEIQRDGCESVAVALLWAHVNNDHERRIGEILDEQAPELDYSLSHRVNPIIREYRRTSSTAIDASLIGPIQAYLSMLKNRLLEAGYDGEPLIIAANGGVMQIDEIAKRPIWTVDSGPTMLPIAANLFVETELDDDNVIALDMGGTSLDMGVVRDGTIPRTREAEVGNTMLSIEKVDVKSIGAGGGSIAWIDDGGLLHVGPQSAGADPGPACYGRGGTKPTLTDACLILGYLNEEYFLGGEMTIDRAAAVEAIETHVCSRTDLDVQEAAYTIYSTANQNMVNGIREMTIERGMDPRNYSLSGGGGALGLHANSIARELHIDDVILPREAGVISSIGGVNSDIRRDFSATQFTESHRFERGKVNDVLESLTEKATAFFDRIDVPEPDRSVSYFAEARYPQQVWEIQIDVPEPPLDEDDEATLVDRFHREHETVYGYQMEEQHIEYLYWRIEATAEEPKSLLDGTRETVEHDVSEAKHQERRAYFDGTTETVDAYRGDLLDRGHTIEGPAIVDANNTTIVLEPSSSLTVSEFGNYHISP